MENQGSRSGQSIVLAIIAVILLVVIGILSWQYNKQVNELRGVQSFLEQEKTDLTSQLKDLSFDLDSLKTKNDTMNQKLEAAQTRIKELLAVKASNTATIILYKKELGTLRDIMKSFIVQIDSLNQKNIKLLSENAEVKIKLVKSEEDNQKLNKLKTELDSLVQTASTLTAKDIVGWGLDKKGKETQKASKSKKLRVCFTIRENSITEAGTKDVYIRVFRPDSVLLAESTDNIFDYNGQQIVFTAKRQIDYENKDVDMCVFCDNKDEKLYAGNYRVEIYSSGEIIGSSLFLLK